MQSAMQARPPPPKKKSKRTSDARAVRRAQAEEVAVWRSLIICREGALQLHGDSAQTLETFVEATATRPARQGLPS